MKRAFPQWWGASGVVQAASPRGVHPDIGTPQKTRQLPTVPPTSSENDSLLLLFL